MCFTKCVNQIVCFVCDIFFVRHQKSAATSLAEPRLLLSSQGQYHIAHYCPEWEFSFVSKMASLSK